MNEKTFEILNANIVVEIRELRKQAAKAYVLRLKSTNLVEQKPESGSVSPKACCRVLKMVWVWAAPSPFNVRLKKSVTKRSAGHLRCTYGWWRSLAVRRAL